MSAFPDIFDETGDNDSLSDTKSNEVRERLAAIEKELSKRERKVAESERLVREAKTQVQAKYDELIRKREAAQQKLNERIKANEDRLNEYAHHLRRRKQRLEQYANGLRKYLQQIRTAKEQPKAEAPALESPEQEVTDLLQTHQATIEQLEERIRTTETEAAGYAKLLQERGEQINQYEATAADAVRRLESLRTEHEKLTAGRAAEVEQLQEQLASLVEQLDQHKETLRQREIELEHHEKAARELEEGENWLHAENERAAAEAVQELEELRAEHERLASAHPVEIERLQQQVTQLVEQLDEHKEMLQQREVELERRARERDEAEAGRLADSERAAADAVRALEALRAEQQKLTAEHDAESQQLQQQMASLLEQLEQHQAATQEREEADSWLMLDDEASVPAADVPRDMEQLRAGQDRLASEHAAEVLQLQQQIASISEQLEKHKQLLRQREDELEQRTRERAQTEARSFTDDDRAAAEDAVRRLEALRAEHEELASQHADEMQRLQQQIASLVEQLGQHKESLRQRDKELEQRTRERDEAEARSITEDERAAAEESVRQLEALRVEHEELASAHADEVRQLQQEMASLLEQLEQHKRTLEQRENELEHYVTASLEREETKTGLRAQNEQLVQDHRASIQQLEEQISRYEELINGYARTEQDLRQASAAWETEHARLKEQHEAALREYDQQLQTGQEQIAQHAGSLAEREQRLAELAARQTELLETESALRSENIRLVQEHQSEVRKLQAQLEENQSLLERSASTQQEMHERTAALETEKARWGTPELGPLKQRLEASEQKLEEHVRALQESQEQIAQFAEREREIRKVEVRLRSEKLQLMETHEAAVQTLEAQLREREERIEQYAARENELRESLSHWESQHAKLAGDHELSVREYEKRARTGDGQIEQFAATEQELRRVQSDLLEENARLLRDHQTVMQSVEKLEQQARSSEEEIQRYIGIVQERDQQIAAQAQIAEHLRGIEADLLAEKTHLRNQLESTAQELEAMRQEKDVLAGQYARVEQQFSDLQASTDVDRDRLVRDQLSSIRHLEDQVRHRDQQIEKYARELNERRQWDVEHGALQDQLTARIETLTGERDEAFALLEKQGESPSPLRELDDAAVLAECGRPESSPAHRQEVFRPKRSAVGTAVALVTATGVVAVAVWAAAIAYREQKPLYSVSGMVMAPAGDAKLLEQLAGYVPTEASASSGEAVKAEMNVDMGSLELLLLTGDRNAGVATVNAIGEGIVRRASAPYAVAPSTRPAAPGDRVRLLEQLRHIDQKIAAFTATQPAGTESGNRSALLKAWADLQAERQKVLIASQAAANRLAAPPPDEQTITLNPAQVQAAEAADAMFQSEAGALGQFEQQLTAALQKILKEGEPSFGDFRRAVAETDKLLPPHLDADDSNDALRNALQAIQKALSESVKVSNSLEEIWHKHTALIGTPAGDALASQALLEAGAKNFISDSTAQLAALRRALESIAEGGTKSIVSRNSLERELQPAMRACDSVGVAARSVMPTQNLELAALCLRVTGLRSQVGQQRERIAATVRQTTLAEQRTQHEKMVTEARTERDRLLRQAAELDQAIAQKAAEVLKRLGEDDAARSGLLAQMDLYRQRADAATQLAAFDGADTAGGMPAPAPFRFIPARAVEMAGPLLQRLNKPMMAAGIPLVMGLLMLGLLWLGRATGRAGRMVASVPAAAIPRESGSPQVAAE